MKKINITLTILAVAIFTGCTGKVQTNPLPNNEKTILPNNKTYGNVLEIKEIDRVDFQEFAAAKLGTGTGTGTEVKRINYKSSTYKVDEANNKLWNYGYKKAKR